MENNIENIDKKLPFEVPEGYFENFEEKMMARLEALDDQETLDAQETRSNVRDIRNVTMRRWATGIAAAAVVLIGIFAVLHLQGEVGQAGEEIVVAATTTADDAYYDEINNELNTEEIEEALAQIALEEY